jgi:AcrR family transcriptional regulator
MANAATKQTTRQPQASPNGRPQRADARRNRKRVLDAARKCFAEAGLDAQIDDIAGCAGLGVGTVYRHFPTKEALIEALAQDRFDRLAEKALEALEASDPWEGFCDFMRYSAQIQASDRCLSEVMGSRPDVMHAAAGQAGLYDPMAKLVRRAQRAGTLRRDVDPEDLPALVCALGRVTNPATAGPTMDWQRLVPIMLDGLRAPSGSTLPPRS